MVHPERQEQNLGDLISRYRVLAIGLGLIAAVGLIAVVVYLIVGGGSQPTDLALATTSSSLPSNSPTAPTTPDAGDLAGVSPVDCDPLITSSEVEEALAIRDRPSGEQGSHGLSIHETCTEQLDSDPAYFVRIEPGNPSDFDAGATLIGVAGEPVADVGDEALWFGGAAAEGGGSAGVLSVGQDTPIGLLQFRIRLGRPDLDSGGQLEIAKSLALAALHRFPGMPPGPPAPVVDLCALVTDEEAEAILGPYRGTHPGTLPDTTAMPNYAGTVDLSRPGDAECTKLILTEIYVKITQGANTDFDAGAEIGGVTGEPVEGLGEAAVWFDGVPYTGGFSAPHDEGILSVRQGTALFHVVVALPDTPEADQLEISKNLATNALARLPGAENTEIVEIQSEDAEVPPMGYVDNLVAKVQSGEWSLEEGLVDTLKLFAGETDASQVLPSDELVDYSGTGVIHLAQDYLDNGTDDEAKAEITRLLNLLAPTREQLQAISETATEPSADAPLFVSLAPVAVQVDPDNALLCQFLYDTSPPCLVERPSKKWPDKYILYRPRGDATDEWPLIWIDRAWDAMEESATKYEALTKAYGGMPPIDIVLGKSGSKHVVTHSTSQNGRCTIFVSAEAIGIAENNEAYFKQAVAAQMAHCLIQKVFAGVAGIVVGLPGQDLHLFWWADGLSVYLSGVVYPDVNFEHTRLPQALAQSERSTTLRNRGSTDWIFFEYLDPKIHTKGIFDLVKGLRGTLPDLASYWHPFNQDLTDAHIPDIGQAVDLVPFKPVRKHTDISGPTRITLTAKPLGMDRRSVSVDRVACVEYERKGDLEASWRTGQPGQRGGAWTDDLPKTLEGDAVYLISSSYTDTATPPDSSLTIDVKKVVDNEDDCDKEETTTTTTSGSTPYNKPDICLECGDSGFYFKKRN